MTIRKNAAWATITLLMAVLLTACATSPAPQNREQRGELISRIMELSGANHSLDHLPEMIQAQFRMQPPPIPPASLDKLGRILVSACAPSRTKKVIWTYLEGHNDARQFRKIADLLQTPLARKMTAMENASVDPEDWQQMMQQAGAFMSQVPQSRLDLLRQLDNAQGVSETILEIQINSFRISAEAINALMPEAQRMPASMIDEISQRIRQEALYHTRQQALLQMAWVYREASDEEIRDYLALIHSRAGQWWKDLMRDATLNVFSTIMADINTQVQAQIIKDQAL